ncbi:MAG: hypothetical protein ACLFRP_01415 [Puniceicoccaceae bacterium]
MKKSELRVWALRTHVPDEWWVDVDGEVSETVVTLDEAFHRAEGSSEAYIIHASHAEGTEDPHWIRMGAETPKDDPFGLPAWVCAKCGFSFENPKRKGGKITACEFLGYLLILPGLAMTIRRRRKTRPSCPHCGATRIVKGSSKAGQVLLSR